MHFDVTNSITCLPAGYGDGLTNLKVIWFTLKTLLSDLIRLGPQLQAILCYFITCQVGGHDEDGILKGTPSKSYIKAYLATNQYY